MKKQMRVLIACEFSGVVRDAFLNKGHLAFSCDLLPTERPGPHIQDDVRNHLGRGWDLMIAFPPCTHLARSGGRYFREKRELQAEAVQFVRTLANAPIKKIAIENPVGVLSTQWAPPSQYIQPFQFGYPETKKTCLWLFDLPYLQPTRVVVPTGDRVYRVRVRSWQWKERSRTLEGIAEAMAEQWG